MCGYKWYLDVCCRIDVIIGTVVVVGDSVGVGVLVVFGICNDCGSAFLEVGYWAFVLVMVLSVSFLVGDDASGSGNVAGDQRWCITMVCWRRWCRVDFS